MSIILMTLMACGPTFDQGWDDGCTDAVDLGYQFGYEDAEECYSADPTPPPGNSGSTKYDSGYDGGFDYCYPDAYSEGYDEAIEYLGTCSR